MLAAFFVLMHGGVFGLTPVDTARWGGFPLTIMLSTIGLARRVSAVDPGGARPPLAVCRASARYACSTSS